MRCSSRSCPMARQPARSRSRAASSTGARALSARLKAGGLAGQTAVLIFPPGLEFLAAFFGCLYARVVAVPAYPPRPNRPMERLESIVADAGPAAVLTCSAMRREAARWSAGLAGLAGVEVVFTDDDEGAGSRDETGPAASWVDPGVAADSLAFLQYTSGSTAAPQG